MLERCGIPIPADILPTDNIHSMPGFDEYQAGDLTDDQYFEQLGKYLGGISSEDAQRVHLSMLIEPFPGVLEIVHQLNAKAIVTGCLSNTNAPHWHDLAESGRFPAIQAMRIRMASHLIDAAKPDPRAFECFLDACGLPPAQVLLFDDSQANCVAAAELGWKKATRRGRRDHENRHYVRSP